MSSWRGERRTERKAPSGLTAAWKLWRHCCCRYGWYPLFVAPVVSAGCMLSMYSSAGCDFVRLDVGFTPSNAAWNQSTVDLGLFYYQSGLPDNNKYKDAWLDGCRPYQDQFNVDFVEDDRTWKVARMMAIISGAASMLAMVTSWLFVISPLPAFFFWPGVLLPSLMAAFLAEGSKFLFFDTSICRNTVWFPSGADSLPRVAESCVLGTTGNNSIQAGAIFFFSLILVCLKAPEQRELDKHFGSHHDHDHDSDLESAIEYAESDGSYEENSQDVYVEERDSFDEHRQIGPTGGDRDRAEIIYTPRGTRRAPKDEELSYTPRGTRRVPREDPAQMNNFDYGLDDRKGIFFRPSRGSEDNSTSGHSDGRDPSSILRRPSSDHRDDADDLVEARMKTLDSSEDRYTAKPKTEKEDDRYQPTKPPKPPLPPSNVDLQRVSESIVSRIEKEELNTTAESDEMIEKFVSDLNLSFQLEKNEEKKGKGLRIETPNLCQTLCAPASARSF